MKTAHERKLSRNRETPFHSQDGKGMDAEVLVKYFNPCGTGTWLITEAEREGDDWRLFGYCHIYEWEWGYLMLSELASLRLPFGLTMNATFTRPGNTSGIFCRRMNDAKASGIFNCPLARQQKSLHKKETINMATFEEKSRNG